MSSTVTKPRGRHFFANPGPTNIPDSVLRALDRPSIDFHDPDFVEVYDAAFAGVKRVLKTQHHLFMYNASGHGAWEASLTNLLSPGNAILVLESGYFSEEWANMARAHGLEVRLVACDWRRGARCLGCPAGDRRQGQAARRRITAGRARLRHVELRDRVAFAEWAAAVAVVVIGGHSGLAIGTVFKLILPPLGTTGPDGPAEPPGQIG